MMVEDRELSPAYHDPYGNVAPRDARFEQTSAPFAERMRSSPSGLIPGRYDLLRQTRPRPGVNPCRESVLRLKLTRLV